MFRQITLAFGLLLLSGTLELARSQTSQVQGAGQQVAAVPVAAQQPASETVDQFTSADYLAAAQRLTLRFKGYPELSGDYRVSPDQTISIPVIGRISIAGMDAGALEKILAAKTVQITQKDAYVTVEIAAYKPVFITGAVKNPGAIEWRPGLTVLQAVTLAGGLAAEFAPGSVGGAGGQVLGLQKYVDSQKRDLAIIARLTAERDGSPRITVPPQLVSLVGKTEASDLITREMKTLTSDRDARAAKLTILEQGIAAGNTEIASLREQIGKLNNQLQLRRDYAQKVKGLFSKGIITAERSMEEEIKVSDLEEKITNINVGLAKSAGTVAELQLNAVALNKDREIAIDTEIARVERESAQLGIDIDAARNVNDELLQKASDRTENQAQTSLFQIVRQEGNKSNTLTVDQNMLMRPGDVLIVGRS